MDQLCLNEVIDTVLYVALQCESPRRVVGRARFGDAGRVAPASPSLTRTPSQLTRTGPVMGISSPIIQTPYLQLDQLWIAIWNLSHVKFESTKRRIAGL